MALARKWRPKNFDDIIGQDIVTRTLLNAIKKNRLHHAYLFTGTRGVGKTTLARIFAMCLSCEQGVSTSPCKSCNNCSLIASGQHIDIIEIDAASKTKVEDTRELLLNVNYAPQQTNFKIFIIDEVHMLSTHSFNALLKTLEEPPAHVKFLLATTDPQKIPATILSRCLQFHLQTISQAEIFKHLCTILAKEAVDFENEAIHIIAKAADGSVRDSLSLLDQAIAIAEQKISQHLVEKMLGHISSILIKELLASILNKSAPEAILKLTKLMQDGQPPLQIINQLLETLHLLILHLSNCNQPCPLDLGNIANWEHNSPNNLEWLHLLYQIGIAGIRDLNFSPTQKHGLEITILRMASLTPPNNDKNIPPWWQAASVKPEQNTKVAPPLADKANHKKITIDQLTWKEVISNLDLEANLKNTILNCKFSMIKGSTLYLTTNDSLEIKADQLKHVEEMLTKQNIYYSINVASSKTDDNTEKIATLLSTFDGKIIE